MPVKPTYPGVYVQEVDSGSRVVTGVPTSITAVVGRTIKGPANTPVTCFIYGDFERMFGGLAIDMPVPYAVQDFFDNGGSQALIVRVCAGPALEAAASLALPGTDPAFTLTARVKGEIGNQIYLSITHHVAAPDPDVSPADQNRPKTFDVALTLGEPAPTPARGARPVTLAKSNPTPNDPGLAPAAIATWLSERNDLVSASGAIDLDKVEDIIEAIANGTALKFEHGQAGTGATAPKFIAGDLEITAQIKGSWTDTLDLTIFANRGPGIDGNYVLTGNHPMLAAPYTIGFRDWADLKTKLDSTPIFTMTKTPTDPKVLAAFAGSSIDLTRMPDRQGASTAMLQLGLGLIATASSPGEWGNRYGVSWDKKNITDDVALKFADYGISGTDDFWNINVVETGDGPKPSWTTVETTGPVYIGPLDAPCRIDHVLAEKSGYLRAFPPLIATSPGAQCDMLSGGFDGEALTPDIVVGTQTARTGIYSFDNADLFNIMVIPRDPLLGGDGDMNVIYGAAAEYCSNHRAVLIADPLDAWGYHAKAGQFDQIQPTDFTISGVPQRRSVFSYFPRIMKPDPLRGNREMVFSASGVIAGIFAATDARRGVWKAPAGLEAGLNGVTDLECDLTDVQNGQLNQVGINALRKFPVVGMVIWGSRTLAGADSMSDDYKYLPVRRLSDYIEESLYRGTKYAVFEPNAEPLWATIRLTIGSFMSDLARQGAFYEYYVRCDASTTTSNDINLGKCNVIVAFAPVKPAEFIIFTIQQLALKPAA